MALIKRSELLNLLADGSPLPPGEAYLFFGERYLCREAADQLQARLLADQPGAVHSIDGDNEEPGRTLARLQSFSLLPGRQIYRVSDSRILVSKAVAKDLWQRATQAFAAGRAVASRRALRAMARTAGVALAETSLAALSGDEWQHLFAFTRPDGDLSWADRLLAEAPPAVDSGDGGGGDLGERYIKAIEAGLPAGALLLLTAETVDKRTKLFSFLKKNQTVVDCSVASGATAAVQSEQKGLLRELMEKTLADFQKKIDPRAVEIFFERIGFHPVAVVVETEKLALFCADRPTITVADLEAMVANNREGALYELTDAFSRQQLARCLLLLGRLLDQGVHALAILATMRNFFRRQLIYRSIQLQPEPLWRRGMSAREFQQSYLPALKSDARWQGMLDGHPYALYMNFTRATELSCAALKEWLAMLLAAEFQLKGAPLPPRLVLEELFLRLQGGQRG